MTSPSTPSPQSTSESLRKLNLSMYPAGPFLVANSEQEEGERMEFHPGENQREPGIVAIWGISGCKGLLSFLESQQGTGTLRPSYSTRQLLMQAHTSADRNMKVLFVQVISISELAICVPRLACLVHPGLKGWFKRTEGWWGPRCTDPSNTLELAPVARIR